MNWWSEVKEEFAKAATRTAPPAVWLPAVLVYGGLSMVIMLSTFAMASRMLVAGYPSDPGGIVVIVLIALAAVPAVLSGLWAVSRKAVVEERAQWRDFWSGTGTYYWRIVGLGALLVVAFMILGPGIGKNIAYGLKQGMPLMGAAIPFMLLYLVARYFTAAVMPAMVFDQIGAFQAIGRGFAFAWRNVPLFAPAVAADLAVAWVIEKLGPQSLVMSSAQALQALRLDAGMAVIYGAVLMVTSVVACFFRILYLGIYQRRRPEVVPAAPPGESPIGPVMEWHAMPPTELPVEPPKPES